MSLLDRIRTCQIWDRARYRPFRIVGQDVGWVTGEFAERLREFPKLFRISEAAVDLDPGLDRLRGAQQGSGRRPAGAEG